MGDESTPQRYVSFSWLIGAFGSVILIVITVGIFAVNHFAIAIEKKVDKEVFAYVCEDIKSIKSTVIDNAKVMGLIDRNQIKVMQKLNIEPERR